MAGINLSSAKPTINISNGVSNKELSMGYVGTRDHTKLANLDYEHSGHTGFQKELTFDTTPTADSTNPVTSGGVKTELDKKADSGDVYTKSETDTLLSQKADTATTLDGYGITDAYTKTEADSKENALILADERLKYYGDKDIVPSDESWFMFTTEEYDGVSYTYVDGITDTGKTQKELVIPYKYNGQIVTGLRMMNNLFEVCSNLSTIIIPDCITWLAGGIFQNCTKLKSIKLPSNLMTIGSGAFGNCTSLTSIVIPNNDVYIGFIAFAGCSSLKKVVIPSTVTFIDASAFCSVYSDKPSEPPIAGLSIYCEQGSYADTYAKENNIPVVYTDVKATSINPTVKTALDDTITVNTIYDLGVQTALTITLPSGQIGDFIQFDFISGSTATDLLVSPATTLTVNSSSGLVGFDLIPGTNTVYTLYFDWGETGLDGTDVTYGWRFNYSEYSIDVA